MVRALHYPVPMSYAVTESPADMGQSTKGEQAWDLELVRGALGMEEEAFVLTPTHQTIINGSKCLNCPFSVTKNEGRGYVIFKVIYNTWNLNSTHSGT